MYERACNSETYIPERQIGMVLAVIGKQTIFPFGFNCFMSIRFMTY